MSRQKASAMHGTQHATPKMKDWSSRSVTTRSRHEDSWKERRTRRPVRSQPWTPTSATGRSAAGVSNANPSAVLRNRKSVSRGGAKNWRGGSRVVG